MLFVAFDGSYGDSEGMAVVDNENFDDHFYNYLDDCSDWNRPSFALWFESNEHDFTPSPSVEWACSVCDKWFESEN
jgi:hypothetical protein